MNQAAHHAMLREVVQMLARLAETRAAPSGFAALWRTSGVRTPVVAFPFALTS